MEGREGWKGEGVEGRDEEREGRREREGREERTEQRREVWMEDKRGRERR